nr:MAG: internal scaffolding protein [Microvirus sp.]
MPKAAVAIAPVMEPNPKIATRYDYPSIARPGVDFNQDDPNSRSVTNQSDKDSTDINLIMKRYEKTGLITDILGNSRPPMYGDFSGMPDFHTLQIRIAKVNEAFDALPAQTRSQFGNNAQNLIDFLSDEKNDDEAVKLGLKVAKGNPDDASNKPENKSPEQLKAEAAEKQSLEAAAAAKGQPAKPAA